MTLLKLKAKQDHLEKEARTRDPIKAISEFVWNALDADATEVRVSFPRNPLGGVDAIIIADNGKGISFERGQKDFENLGDSWKRIARTTANGRFLHGKEGRGRLRFFSLAERAEWKSVYSDDAGASFKELNLKILSQSLEECDVGDVKPSLHAATGTTVELVNLKENFEYLLSGSSKLDFTLIFSPYILLYPGIKIYFNDELVDPEEIVDKSKEFPISRIHGENRLIDDLVIRIIEWKSQINGRKIHLGGDRGIVLASIPVGVNAPGFEFSVYAYSRFFEEIANANLFDVDGLTDPDFKKVLDHIKDKVSSYFRNRMVERSRGLIDALKMEGAYPYDGEPKNEIENKERQIFDIATFAVSSYSREFKKAETSMRRMTLTLMKEALRSNPDSLTNILRAVINLPKNRQDDFSSLLQYTELGNIITASKLIADRVATISILRGMVFNPKYRHSVKERGELDVIVRDNTWIFGEYFHLTLPETGLTKVMARVSEDMGRQKSGRPVRKLDGKTGRVDCFLGRNIPGADARLKEYIVIELKKPSITIGREELAQVEDYANALRAQSDFRHTETKWHFYLVTGDYDDYVKNRISQKGRARGIVDEAENSVVWVKSWAEVIRDCEARLNFIQKELNIEISNDEIDKKIAQLRASILKEDKSDQMDDSPHEHTSHRPTPGGQDRPVHPH